HARWLAIDAVRGPVRGARRLGRRRADREDQPGHLRQPTRELDLDRWRTAPAGHPGDAVARVGRGRAAGDRAHPRGRRWRAAVTPRGPSVWSGMRVVATLCILVALVLPLTAAVHADALDDGVRRIALQLQCPVCEGQNAADSPSGL